MYKAKRKTFQVLSKIDFVKSTETSKRVFQTSSATPPTELKDKSGPTSPSLTYSWKIWSRDRITLRFKKELLHQRRRLNYIKTSPTRIYFLCLTSNILFRLRAEISQREETTTIFCFFQFFFIEKLIQDRVIFGTTLVFLSHTRYVSLHFQRSYQSNKSI